MEYCSGGDLLQRILQQKTTQFCTGDVGSLLHYVSGLSLFSISSGSLTCFSLQILQWFAQLCAGTQHIHEKRVLHRDLKSKVQFYADMEQRGNETDQNYIVFTVLSELFKCF